MSEMDECRLGCNIKRIMRGKEDESWMSKLMMMDFYVLIYDLTNTMYYLITTPELSVRTDSPVIDTEFKKKYLKHSALNKGHFKLFFVFLCFPQNTIVFKL